MSDWSRREFGMAMAAFATLAGVADAQGDATMGLSKVFRYGELPVVKNANGGESRAVMHGTLLTGEFVEVHETMLPAGQMPHPPHQHRNTEFVLVREGKLEFLNDGKPEPVGVGDVIYTASNQMHGLKNVGETSALYFVVSVSHGQM